MMYSKAFVGARSSSAPEPGGEQSIGPKGGEKGFVFVFNSRLAVGGCNHRLPLQEQVALARQTFPKQDGGTQFNLCISHQKRQQIIRDIQKRELAAKREAGVDVLYLAPVFSSTANKTQDLYLWKGKVLVCVATLKTTYNSQLLVVKRLGRTMITCTDYDTDEEVVLPHATVAKHCRSASALTYASCQGRGLPEVGLWDTTSPRFTKRHLFMGLSRARVSSRLWICD